MNIEHDEIDTVADEEDGVDLDQESTDVDDEAQDAESESTQEGGDAQESDESELEVSLDGEPVDVQESEEERHAPSWVKSVRKENRVQAREIKELKAKLAALQSPKASEDQDPGKKPKLEDFGFDTDAFEPALEKWVQAKAQADQRKAEKQRQAESEAAEWQNRLKEYETGKKRLRLSDFEDAEEVLKDTLNQTQQGLILHVTKDPALFVYATAKSPRTLQELAAQKDPAKFAAMLGKIEEKIKMAPRKPAPQPERKLSVSGGATLKSQQATLEKLREQAEKTGDRTAVVRYLKQQAQKKA